MTTELSIALIMAATMLAQAAVPDWTHMASLPFAFAAASFLIWSMVALVRMMFDSWKEQSAATVSTLREQVQSLRKFQDEVLVGLIAKVSTAMEKDADASNASCVAWGEVHEDFQQLLGVIKNMPCKMGAANNLKT